MFRTYAQNRAGRTASPEHDNDMRAVLEDICNDSVSIKDSQAATALMNWTLKQSEAPHASSGPVSAQCDQYVSQLHHCAQELICGQRSECLLWTQERLSVPGVDTKAQRPDYLRIALKICGHSLQCLDRRLPVNPKATVPIMGNYM